MIKFKRLTIALLALLCISATAWAGNEKLLAEITPANAADYSDIVTITTSGSVTTSVTGFYSNAWGASYGSGNSGSMTVKVSDDVDVARCVVKCTSSGSRVMTGKEFTVYLYCYGSVPSVYADAGHNDKIGQYAVSSIQIYASDPVTISDDKSEATFTMPNYDVTATYALKRDITVDVTAELPSRIRIAKSGPTYMPVNDAEWLPVVTDNLDGDNPVEMINETDYIRQLEKQGTTSDEWSYAGSFSVGTFRWKITGTGNYTGTIYSNEFQLYQGYEVAVPAGEYVTYYKDEALYVEDEQAKLYTITAVNEDKATATEVTVAAAGTPLLVKNNAAEPKTILLIPTTDQTPDVVEVYDGFKGTLVETQIAASDDTQNNYALNGKEFVWVKEAVSIGKNKAWLEVPATNAAAARALSIVFGSEPTGITTTNYTNYTNGDWYDLNGRKLQAAPTKKGIYIHNGKKVVK